MKLYLKILLSTMLAAVAIPVMVSLFDIIVSNDANKLLKNYRILFNISFGFFIGFGMPGSILWYVLYRFKFSLTKPPKAAHVSSVGASIISTAAILTIIMSVINMNLSQVLMAFNFYLMIAGIGGGLSLLFYWVLFLRKNKT